MTRGSSPCRPATLAAVAAVLLQLPTSGLAAQPLSGDQLEPRRSAYHDYRVVPVADGFVQPWSIAFLPGGDMLVTERAGRLRIVRDGVLLPRPVSGVPEVFAVQHGGLFDILPHPNFATNRLVYLSYAKPVGDGSKGITAVVRGTLENDRFIQTDKIFEAVSRASRWGFGGKLAFDADGYLWLTVGDHLSQDDPLSQIWGNLRAHPAQDLSDHQGVVARLHDDGRVPDDNPFVGKSGAPPKRRSVLDQVVRGPPRAARPETWSYGHRNPQGLAIHPETGAPWITEHGPKGGDEVNRPEAGKNYGWPVIGYGVNYDFNSIHASTHADGMEQPLHVWVPSIAPSGLAFYTGDKFPEWRGNLFAGGLYGQCLERFTVEGGRITAVETLMQGVGRVRDVRQGPDGYIYVAIVGWVAGERTPIVRLEPAGAGLGPAG